METVPKLPIESTPRDSHTLRHNEYEVDVYKLIHLTEQLPSQTILIADYMDQLDDDCWTDANEKRVTPRMVAQVYSEHGLQKGMELHPELAKHLRQIDAADYSFPLVIFEKKIIDGSHRLAKAFAMKETAVPARILVSIPEGAIIQMHPRE